MKKYSSITGGFYDDEIHSFEQIPIDAVDITSDEYESALNGQAVGLKIVPGVGGKPGIIAYTKKPEDIANEAKAKAKEIISDIRKEITERLADIAVGTPAEQGQAKAAIGLLRASLALEKSKL